MGRREREESAREQERAIECPLLSLPLRPLTKERILQGCHIVSHSLSLTSSLALSHSFTLSHSLPLTHSIFALLHSRILTLALCFILPRTLSLSLSLSSSLCLHTSTHSHTQTHASSCSRMQSLSCSLVHTYTLFSLAHTLSSGEWLCPDYFSSALRFERLLRRCCYYYY